MEEKKPQIFWSIWNIAEAVILVLSGILCIAFRDNQDLAKWISIIIGIFVLLDGGLRILLYFMGTKNGEESGALVGGFEATLGIVVIVQFRNFLAIIITFLYVLLMVIGALILIMSILKIKNHRSTLFIPILQIVLGAISFSIGLAICIIFAANNGSTNTLIMIVVGTILLLVGLTQGVLIFIQNKKAGIKFSFKKKLTKKEDKVEVIEQK